MKFTVEKTLAAEAEINALEQFQKNFSTRSTKPSKNKESNSFE